MTSFMANLSIFIPHETKPGKGKIASLLKSIGFVERTSTPLWSYTYTRLRVDQVDYRDDFYDDSDWLYETEFDTKWAVRVSLHTKHKENHKALWHSLALIISQVYDIEELYTNAPGTDVPGPAVEATKLGSEAFTTKETPEELKELVETAVMPTPVVENKTEDEYYPEPTVEVVPEPQIQQPTQAIEEDDWRDDEDEDDWDDDEDDWGDDEDEEVQTLELKPVQSEEEDPWEEEFEDEDDEDEDDEEDFDGIVTWD